MALFAFLGCCVLGAQELPTREMNDLNWMEFRDIVPARVKTVLLPTGTMEAHGVINNGADNTAPLALSRALATKVNALVAPLIPYGVTGSLDGYAGTFQVSEAAYRPFVEDVLRGLAKNGFRNIVVINGHGGPQTEILSGVAEKVSRDERVRVLVTNWWAICSEVTLKTFGEDGGHAGWNETAFIQGIDRKLVKQNLYSRGMEIARPDDKTWTAYPFPAPVILYKEGQGSVRFDQQKADSYFAAVVDRMAALIQDTVQRWDRARIYE